MTRTCNGCLKPTESNLKCPKCVQLGLPSAFFCSQDCFKDAWKTHSEVHKTAASNIDRALAEVGMTVGATTLAAGYKETDMSTWEKDFHLQRFVQAGYTFTGPLRPWPQTITPLVGKEIPKPDYASHPGGRCALEEKTRREPPQPCTENEIASLRKCCRIAREALDLAHSLVAPGVTTDFIDQKVHQFILSKGGYPSPLNYYKFPKSCCTSVNEVVCHGIPDLRPLQEGDIVNVDVTVYYDGVHGDLNETFFVGEVDDESKRLVKATYDSLMAAIAICKPGEMYRRIGTVIADIVEPLGFSVVRTYCGHGIGTLFHTAPNVPHYRANKAKGLMKIGHVFTIEPMINAGKAADELWPDDWTSVTVDGKRSAQFEHTLLVTETGVEILTERLPESPPLGF